MDVTRALEQELKRNMENLLKAEKQSKTAGGRSTVILFIPRDVINLNNNDLTIAKEQLKYFREYLPGMYIKRPLCKLAITISLQTLQHHVIYHGVYTHC
jgi:hypothetical protein